MDYTLDYYNVLRVAKSASKQELRAAYRHLAKLHHPDRNPGDPGATDRFRSIQEAYEVLSSEITRHLYDEYRAAKVPKTAEQAEKATAGSYPKSPGKNVYTQTSKVWREKRIYVKGRIQVKFQGSPEQMDTYMLSRERNYTIFPTECLVTMDSADLYKSSRPKDYEKAYSSAELFAVPLRQPLRCVVSISGNDEIFDLTIHDLKIKDPRIVNITQHEDQHFGELVGDSYGYIVHRYEEEVSETYTFYFGSTGKVEVKEEAGAYFSRQQFYAKDGSTFWGEWETRKSAATDKNPAAKTRGRFRTRWQAARDNRYIGWLIYLFLACLAWPKFIVPVLLVIGLCYLVYGSFKFLGGARRFLPWLAFLLFILFFLLGIGGLFSRGAAVGERRMVRERSVATRRNVLPDNRHDTLISHLVRWNDYDSNGYTVELKILQSAVNSSKIRHQSMEVAGLSSGNVGAVYAQLEQMDSHKLTYVYAVFDSIIKARQLNELQSANMIVSCIQSIPYILIVDRSCDAEYNDAFISSYLRACQQDCCLGNVRFGVQSPAEFIGDLKGDCDTRALALFDILSKLGYDVALMTSPFYKHAMIAMHFNNETSIRGVSMPIENKNFYMWETTNSGFRPGVIPPAISNLQYWNPSLIHQQ